MALGHCGALGQPSDPGRGTGPCCSLQLVVLAMCVRVGGVLVCGSLGMHLGDNKLVDRDVLSPSPIPAL